MRPGLVTERLPEFYEGYRWLYGDPAPEVGGTNERGSPRRGSKQRPVGAKNTVLPSCRRPAAAAAAGARCVIVMPFVYWALRRLIELVAARGLGESAKEIELVVLRDEIACSVATSFAAQAG